MHILQIIQITERERERKYLLKAKKYNLQIKGKNVKVFKGHL